MHGKGQPKQMKMREKMSEMGPGNCCQCMAMSGKRPMRGMGMMVMITNLGLDEKHSAEFKAIHIEMKKNV